MPRIVSMSTCQQNDKFQFLGFRIFWGHFLPRFLPSSWNNHRKVDYSLTFYGFSNFEDLGFKNWGLGFKNPNLGFRIQKWWILGFRILKTVFKKLNLAKLDQTMPRIDSMSTCRQNDTVVGSGLPIDDSRIQHGVTATK